MVKIGRRRLIDRAVSTSSTVTEADILAEIITPDKPGLDPDAARAILGLQFNNHARERIRQLLDANNRGKISDAEHAELQKYLRVGQFIDLMQAKARLSLPESSATCCRRCGTRCGSEQRPECEYCQLPQTCTVLPRMFPAKQRVNYGQTRNRKPPQSFYALFYAFSISIS